MVELLVAIAIIAMLMGLLITGIRKAMTSAKQSGIVFEITRLATSIEGVKSKAGVYPPCMAALTTSSVYADSPTRFNKYLRSAFPRCLVTYNDLVTGMGTQQYQYTFRSSTGSIGTPKIQTLDPAEALVFWLGGFPTPWANGQPVSSRKIIGFHSDPTNPFKLDTTLTARTPPLYDFDDDRLVDNDNDGWLEYTPNIDLPPFVYFDAALYTNKSQAAATTSYNMYPLPTTALASQWGVIGPYAGANLQTGMSMQWLNPNTFQILSSGLDGMYGPSASPTLRITVPSTGVVYQNGQPSSVGTLSTEESDNLANFTDGTIFDAIGK